MKNVKEKILWYGIVILFAAGLFLLINWFGNYGWRGGLIFIATLVLFIVILKLVFLGKTSYQLKSGKLIFPGLPQKMISLDSIQKIYVAKVPRDKSALAPSFKISRMIYSLARTQGLKIPKVANQNGFCQILEQYGPEQIWLDAATEEGIKSYNLTNLPPIKDETQTNLLENLPTKVWSLLKKLQVELPKDKFADSLLEILQE